jgi:leucyl aminopeptidase
MELSTCLTNRPHRLIFVGLGKQNKVTLPAVRKAVSTAVDKLKALKLTHATLTVPHVSESRKSEAPALGEVLQTMANTSVLSDYRFDKYITREDSKSVALQSLTLLSDALPSDAALLVREAVTVAECTNYARDLANERAEIATPAFYEQQARRLQAEYAPVMDIEVLQYEDLLHHGLNLLAAVGQGAPVLPRLVLLRYRGNPDSTGTLV